MSITLRSLVLTTFLTTALTAARAEDLTLRYLGSAGGLAAHELAAELGCFDGTGITLENIGKAICCGSP